VFEYGGTHAAGTPLKAATDPAPTAVSLDASTGKPVWTETPSDSGAGAIVPSNPVLPSSSVPGADGHGVAFAFTGLFSNNKHLVRVLDSRTGTEVNKYEIVGSSTFQGFTASKTAGMVEFSNFGETVYPADGSAPYQLASYLDTRYGVFAKSIGGTEAFVTAE